MNAYPRATRRESRTCRQDRSPRRWRGVAAVAALAALTSCGRRGDTTSDGAPLRVLVGGTMRPAMEALIKDFTARTGQKVEMDNGDSGELMLRIEQTRSGDLYVCHDPFLATLQRKGFCDKAWTVASLKPVIVVPKGNPKAIRGFRDLARPGLKLILTDRNYSTAGHIVARMAEKAGIAAALESNVVSRTRGGGQAANAVALGAADAAVTWDAVAFLRADKLEAVAIEPAVALRRGVDAVTTATYGTIDMGRVAVTVATLTCSRDVAAARRFGEFIAAAENRNVWASFGYSPADDGGAAAASPSADGLFVYCGAGMRPAVSEMAQAFEARTGTRVALTFDGSNRLLGQIKLSHKGDVYIPGDAEYVDLAVKDGLIGKRAGLCWFVPAILTAKGNPHGIRSLGDALKPGLRIGQGDPRSAAVGRIMPELLARNGVDATAWRKNVVMETATVNELAVAVKLGTLDAAVVWDAVAKNYAGDSDTVAIAPGKSVCPPVEAAVLSYARDPALAGTFVDFMASDEGRGILRKHGYRVDNPAPGNEAPAR